MVTKKFMVGLDVGEEDYDLYLAGILKENDLHPTSVEYVFFGNRPTIILKFENGRKLRDRLNQSLVGAQAKIDRDSFLPLPRKFAMDDGREYEGIFESVRDSS